jgi:2-oxoisovalerate dehydrogenase E1 component
MVHKELLSLFRTMLIIRHTEEELARCHQRGLIFGACHTYVGMAMRFLKGCILEN